MAPNVRMSATSTAPVASVLASSATATFPPASRSPMMPDPTTAARSRAVPTSSDMRALMLGAALRTAARFLRGRLGLAGPHEGARERAAVSFVDPPGLQLDFGKARRPEFCGVLAFLEGPGDAADPELHVAANVLGHFTTDHDIGNGETAARLQHPKC